jgi:hypothetical protein
MNKVSEERIKLRIEYSRETDLIFSDNIPAYADWLEEKLALSQHDVSGSTLPIGFKVYVCTECGEINVKKDNREIRVGFCDECGHPLWNDDVD